MAKSTAIDKPMSESDWQAQMDAETIANASVIQNDQMRMAAAKKMAGKMAEDKAKRMEEMKTEHDALSNLAMKDKKKDMTSKSKIDKPKKIEKKQVKKMDKPKTKVSKKEK